MRNLSEFYAVLLDGAGRGLALADVTSVVCVCERERVV